MLTILVLEIDGDRRARAYRDRAQAQMSYDEAARVCMDGPDDEDGVTPYLISNCWLYSVDTPDEDIACQSALIGNATLIASFS